MFYFKRKPMNVKFLTEKTSEKVNFTEVEEKNLDEIEIIDKKNNKKSKTVKITENNDNKQEENDGSEQL